MSESSTAHVHKATDCQWNMGTGCQFSGNKDLVKVFEFEGRNYCQFHLPLRAPFSREGYAASFNRVVGHNGSGEPCNLDGIQFPADQYALNSSGKCRKVSLRHCSVAPGTTLILGTDSYDFSSSRFGESKDEANSHPVTIHINRSAHIEFNDIECRSRLKVEESVGGAAADNWSICRSKFYQEVDWRGISFRNGLTLDGSIFFSKVFFEGATFPQQTSAIGTRFKEDAICSSMEGQFRSARRAFGEQKNRELEGKFYAYEKRSHRKSLSQSWRYALPCFFSWLYDLTAEYGHSYGRALLSILIVQVAFSLGYSAFSGGDQWRFDIRGDFDSAAVVFGIAQITRPFELLSSRFEATGVYEVILGTSNPVSGWWVFWTILNSVISISLLALFLLALRWRFRRD